MVHILASGVYLFSNDMKEMATDFSSNLVNVGLQQDISTHLTKIKFYL